ncbi:MAG: hypothetical protein C0404_00100 [Verrucomicrobia bacterium]|nr:hypothetical protein [Verrucomicrobiota bacterium]
MALARRLWPLICVEHYLPLCIHTGMNRHVLYLMFGWAMIRSLAAAEAADKKDAQAAPAAAPGIEKEATMLTVDMKAIACKSFMGFGVEWDPGFWQEWNIKAGVTEADWKTVKDRIEWMKIPLVRMMAQVKWCYREGGKYDWESTDMKSLYRHLDVCQERKVTVILSDWGCEPNWLKAPGIADVGDPKYAAAIGTYMDHLLNKKGYTCIRYFVMVNEPNYEVKDWNRWKKGVENVSAEFARRGIDKKVVFVGSDESNDESWHRTAVDQLQNKLGAYDVHRYAPADEVRSGRLEEFWRTQWTYALEKDRKADGKPMIVGEAGILSDGFSAGNNPLHLNYEYGLYMADYAAQAANAGSWAVSAWMLDDSSHSKFNWGMWKDKTGKFELKPWFYTWSLLTRYVPAGSTIYRTKSGQDLRLLAARSAGASGDRWTFLIVNRADRAAKLKIVAPGAKSAKFKQYVYSKQKAAADANGFPAPVEENQANPAAGLNVECPPQSACLVTSIEY